jgi:protein transport protein SEC31
MLLLLQDFCSRKAATAGSTEESETWTFMGVLFEDDARRQLLAKLGFSEAMLPQAAASAAAAGRCQDCLPSGTCPALEL